MVMLPPLLVMTAPLLMTRVLNDLAPLPLIAPAPPVKVMVEVPPAIVPAVFERVFVMVTELLPKSVVAPELANVRLLKVVVPEMFCVPALPLIVTVPARDVNVPLFVQLPPTDTAKLLALTSSVVLALMFRSPLTVAAPVSVAVLPLPTLMVRCLKLDAPICGAAPVKITVPVAVKVPDSVHVLAPVPVTVMVLPLSTSVPAV